MQFLNVLGKVQLCKRDPSEGPMPSSFNDFLIRSKTGDENNDTYSPCLSLSYSHSREDRTSLLKGAVPKPSKFGQNFRTTDKNCAMFGQNEDTSFNILSEARPRIGSGPFTNEQSPVEVSEQE